MAKYRDIPQFPKANWAVNVGWNYLEAHIEGHSRYGLNLEPQFQRAHVWTREQQVAYVEYILRGGEVSKTLTFSARGWHNALDVRDYVIVDGKQRLEAVRSFMRNEIPAFGAYRSEYTDHLRITVADFVWQVVELNKPSDVLELYLNINAGGTPHTPEEIARVRAMLDAHRRGDRRPIERVTASIAPPAAEPTPDLGFPPKA